MSKLSYLIEGGILQNTPLKLKDLRNAEKIIIYENAKQPRMFYNKGRVSEYYRIFSKNPEYDFYNVKRMILRIGGEISEEDYVSENESVTLAYINDCIKNRNITNSISPNGIKIYYFPKAQLKGYNIKVHKPRSSMPRLNVRGMF